MTEKIQKKKDLGIFYTPEIVVDFIYDILNLLKKKEDKEIKRWESRKPRPHYPSVIDPACGEGIFLKKAIESGFTGYHPTFDVPYIFGVDIDENVVNQWEEISILGLFKNNRKTMKNHFYWQNGLVDLPDRKLPYKKAEDGLLKFDAVVGNPPYGGLGIYDDMKTLAGAVWSAEKVQTVDRRTLNTLFGEEIEKITKETKIIHKSIPLSPKRLLELKALSKALLHYVIWKDKSYITQRVSYPLKIGGVDFNLKDLLILKEIERLKSFPIEVLFIERFIQLTKPGGLIAIIIPDGILTNSNLEYVRGFIADNTKIEAIVSLPRGTFKQAGTSAKTSILFLTKSKDLETHQKLKNDYPVFLASANSISKDTFNKISHHYKQFLKDKYMTTTNPHKKSNILIKEFSDGTTVRVDITMKKMMMERPTSRWDAHYWLPRYDLKLPSNFPIKELGGFIKFITYGQVGRREFVKQNSDTIRYLAAKNFIFTGINWTLKERYIKKGGWNDPLRSRPKEGDVLLVGVGVATTGRVAIVDKMKEMFNFGQDIKLLRLQNINPFYVCVFLKSSFGQVQINRIKTGVGTINLDYDDIRSFKIPVIPEKIQKDIESEYKEMSAYHDKAMEAKTKSDQKEYEKNIKIAEDMLKDLISRTEQVIRGERKDVV